MSGKSPVWFTWCLDSLEAAADAGVVTVVIFFTPGFANHLGDCRLCHFSVLGSYLTCSKGLSSDQIMVHIH